MRGRLVQVQRLSGAALKLLQVRVAAAHVAEWIVGDVHLDEAVRHACLVHRRKHGCEVDGARARSDELALRHVGGDRGGVVLQVAGDDAARVPAEIHNGVDPRSGEPADVELDLDEVRIRVAHQIVVRHDTVDGHELDVMIVVAEDEALVAILSTDAVELLRKRVELCATLRRDHSAWPAELARQRHDEGSNGECLCDLADRGAVRQRAADMRDWDAHAGAVERALELARRQAEQRRALGAVQAEELGLDDADLAE